MNNFKKFLLNLRCLSQYNFHPGDHFSLPFNNFLSTNWELYQKNKVYLIVDDLRDFSNIEDIEMKFWSSYNFSLPFHQPHHKGLFLLELICEQLDVSEKDYFGIKFVDNLKQRVSFETKSINHPVRLSAQNPVKS